MATGSVDRGDLSLEVLFPSEYVKAADLQGKQVTVTLTGGNVDSIPMTGGRHERKLCFTLAKTPKRWILGKTNAYALALLFAEGPKFTNLKACFGKRVTLVADADTMKGQPCAALRIIGSPDAPPERAAMYARAWRGKRERGALCSRLKTALQLLALGAPPPVEDIDEQADEREQQYESVPVDEVFGAAAEVPIVAAAGGPDTVGKTKRAREPGEEG